MHFHNNKNTFFNTCYKILNVLPLLFWAFLIFGLDTPFTAINTLIAASVHEGGHIFAMMILGKKPQGWAKLNGLRLGTNKLLSYREELLVAAAGPLANLIISLIFIPLAHFIGDGVLFFILINLLTGTSNLLPLYGYDGYRILSAAISLKNNNGNFVLILKGISVIFTSFIIFFSLYLIQTSNSGWWIWFVLIFSLLRELGN